MNDETKREPDDEIRETTAGTEGSDAPGPARRGDTAAGNPEPTNATVDAREPARSADEGPEPTNATAGAHEPAPPADEVPAPAGRAAKPNRRRFLRGAAAGAAGLAVGAVGGAFVGVDATVPQTPPTQKRRFADRVVLITGATSGIGAAAARAYAAEGAKVGFCGRRADRGKAVEAEIRKAGGEATYIKADVRDEDDVAAFVDTVAETYGGLHVAFNNAGISMEKPLHEFSAAEFDEIFETNIRGTFLAMKYELPHLLDAGGGNILITSSVNALSSRTEQSVYAASKAAQAGLMRSAALDYGRHGIQVNAILPGLTDTELARKLSGVDAFPDEVFQIGVSRFAKDRVPAAGRISRAEEVAALALALTSGEYPFMMGSQVVMDGGQTAFSS